MMRIYCLLLIFLLRLAFPGYSQTFEIDSLENLISSHKDDTSKVALFLSLSEEYSQISHSDQRIYLLKALSLSEKLNDQLAQAKTHANLSLYFLEQNQIEEANVSIQNALSIYKSLEDFKSIARVYAIIGSIKQKSNDIDSTLIYFDKAYSLSDSIGDGYGIAQSQLDHGVIQNHIGNNKLAMKYCQSAMKYFKANHKDLESSYTMNTIGIIYDEMGFYDEALSYYLESLDIVLKLNDRPTIITLYNNIALIYDYMKNTEKAMEYYQKASEILKVTNDEASKALILNNMAELEAQLGDTIKSIDYLKQSINISKKLSNLCDLAYSYDGIGSLYVQKNRLDSSYFYLNEAVKLGEICRDKNLLSSAYKNMGLLYKKLRDNKNTLVFLQKALTVAKNAGLQYEINRTYIELSRFHESIGELKEALSYHKLFQQSKDSIFNSERLENVAKMTLEYDFKKERKLTELENEKVSLKMAAQLESEEQKKTTILIVLFLSILLIGTLLRLYFIINKRNKELTLLNEEKNTLIGVVAHDLRSPLNNMKALIPIIRNSTSKKDLEHFLALFDKSTLRMSDMINRILDINAIESQKISIKEEKCDVTEILDNTINSFDASIIEKKLRVYKNFELEKLHKAVVDRNYLTQVFENIISNAIKFSESNRGLYFGIKLEEGKVVISVKDEGQGINKEDLEHLFIKYQKLTARPTANESSTGLGLSNAKKYVEAMKGRIWCQSDVGKGSTFFISFKSAID